MVRSLLAALVLAVSFQAQAVLPASETVTPFQAIVQTQLTHIMDQAETAGLDWKVGDRANYSLDMGFIKGTMNMSVASIGADGIWMLQDADLGFLGKQKIETLIDPNTGEIKKMLVNGKEEAIPEQNIEVIEMVEDKITVPAGTFECIHARLKDLKDNSEINAWLNPGLVPLSGMLKQTAPSQFGTVTMLLTSFQKN